MRLMLPLIGLALVTSACAPTQSEPTVPPPPSPGAPSIDDAAAAVNQLGFRLWAEQPPAMNVFYSPFGIHQALSMLYLGAAGETRAQLGQLLGASGDDAADLVARGALAAALRPREGADRPAFTLRASNGVFVLKGYPIERTYLSEVAAADPTTEVRSLDFKGNLPRARTAVNRWVEQQTAGAIPVLVGPNDLAVDTRLVLASTVYFQARWLMEFEPAETEDGPFTLADGTEVTVPRMRKRDYLRYAETPEYQAVLLPYVGQQVSALVVLPRAGAVEAVESTVGAKLLEETIARAELTQVDLRLPRFEVRPTLPLAADLRALGLTDVFDPAYSDLSAICTSRRLFVTDALHQAYIKVDEEGTEAAAATALGMADAASPPGPQTVVMTVDRPFLFLVRDDATGALLFMGRIADPRG